MSDYISRQAAIDAIKALPSAQPERLTDDDFETIRIHLSAHKEKLCNQRRWKEAYEYQRIIDRFMAFASAQPERLTDDEIQRMQDLEQAQIEKAYQLGYEEGKKDAQPERKKGKWICWYEEIKSESCIEYIPHCKCSECGTEYDSHTVKFINFCSHCGADMRGDKDERL